MSSRPATVLHVSRLGWCIVGIALLLPWCFAGWLFLRNEPAAASPATPRRPAIIASRGSLRPSTASNAAHGNLRPGPWGDLLFTRILLEPPEAMIPFDTVQPAKPEWTFKGFTPDRLDALWQAAALDRTTREAFDSTREVSAGGIIVRPDPVRVAALTSTARGRIYTVLAQFAENVPQHEPFRFRRDGVDDWFSASGLPDDIVTLTKSLLYERGPNVYLSDADLVLPHLKSSQEQTRFLKTLSRKSAFLLELHIEATTNVDGIAQYWNRGRRSKDLKPLLQSLVNAPGGATLDVIHLLPPFPRAHLYTYPLPSDNPREAQHDCHWSTFNFFADTADERFDDIEFVKQTVLNDYYPVAGEPEFGDVIMLVQPDGVVVHSCVYVADDIVFTKNGSSFSVPWILTRLDNVVTFYSLTQPLEQRRYRWKRL